MSSATARTAAQLGALALALGCGEADDALREYTAASSGRSFTHLYQSSEFQTCSGCHAPGAPGRTEGTEATQDWSTRDRAYATLHGTASGLSGNFSGCNGVPFLGESAEQSLLVAAFDEEVRAAFQSPAVPSCDADAISDQTLKLGGPLPPSLLAELKAWVNAGAPDE
ncbi:MAG TPA: hypothetical protein VFS67_03125 [Polyangiaceae bacterium]|jgi:hypothetical protein|nr:hypothetical protein [Polyangiaceae bacterium]